MLHLSFQYAKQAKNHREVSFIQQTPENGQTNPRSARPGEKNLFLQLFLTFKLNAFIPFAMLG